VSRETGQGRLRTIGEALTGAAVIASLIFVGLELRQNTAAVRAQTRQGLAEQNTQFVSLLAGTPEVARAWAVRWELFGPQPNEILTLADSVQAEIALLGMLRMLENVYLQAQEGVVDRGVLDTYGFRNTPVLQGPRFAQRWPLLRIRFDRRFVAALEEEYDLPRR
jgi:hypothetical protein